MKTVQIIYVSVILAFTASCKEEQKPEGQQDHETVPKAVIDTVTADTVHNSQNFLDWTGTYSGTTPCPDCPGMKTDITLNTNNTYSLKEQYLEKEKTPRSFSGTFSWDDTKNVITLDANGDHHKFKVMEGKLRLLDKFGDNKQGGKPQEFEIPKIK